MANAISHQYPSSLEIFAGLEDINARLTACSLTLAEAQSRYETSTTAHAAAYSAFETYKQTFHECDFSDGTHLTHLGQLEEQALSELQSSKTFLAQKTDDFRTLSKKNRETHEEINKIVSSLLSKGEITNEKGTELLEHFKTKIQLHKERTDHSILLFKIEATYKGHEQAYNKAVIEQSAYLKDCFERDDFPHPIEKEELEQTVAVTLLKKTNSQEQLQAQRDKVLAAEKSYCAVSLIVQSLVLNLLKSVC